MEADRGTSNRKWAIQSVADPTEEPAGMLSTAIKQYLNDAPNGKRGTKTGSQTPAPPTSNTKSATEVRRALQHASYADLQKLAGANGLRAIGKKDILLETLVRFARPETLRIIDRRSRTIRYLGAWVNLELTWEVQLSRMRSSFGFACSNIRGYSFPLDMSVVAMKQFVMSRLRTGLRHANITLGTLADWDVKYRAAVYAGAGISMGQDLATEALYILTEMLPLQEHRWVMAGDELMATLNAEYPSSKTTRARCNAHQPRESWEPKTSRADRVLEMLHQHDVAVFQYASRLRCPDGPLEVIESQHERDRPRWKAHEVPVLFTVSGPHRKTGSRIAYVDASSGGTRALPDVQR
jgi:hypothetical protein